MKYHLGDNGSIEMLAEGHGRHSTNAVATRCCQDEEYVSLYTPSPHVADVAVQMSRVILPGYSAKKSHKALRIVSFADAVVVLNVVGWRTTNEPLKITLSIAPGRAVLLVSGSFFFFYF